MKLFEYPKSISIKAFIFLVSIPVLVFPVKGQEQADTKKGLIFSGSNYVDCGNPSGNLFDFTGEGTIEAWVKFTTPPPNGGTPWFCPILAKDEGPGDINKWIFGVQNAVLFFHFNSPNENKGGIHSRDFKLSLNKYYHFAVSKDNHNRFTFFVNGVNMGSTTAEHVIPVVDAPMLIGGAEPTLVMKGEIYEVRFWKKELTENEIKQWMFRKIDASHPEYASLAACFRLNERKGSVIYGQKGMIANLKSGPIPLWDKPFLPDWIIILIVYFLIVAVLCIMIYRMRQKMRQEKIDMELFTAQMSHESNNGIGMMINILSSQLNENGFGHLETQLNQRLRTIADMQSTEYILAGEREIAFKKYINDLVEKMNLAFNEGKQIVYDMDLPERIKAKYAMKLAILIRELTLNSLKHAFSGKTKGEINISIRPAGKGFFRFEFCDNGSGIVEQKKSSLSVGTALINSVSSQLGGKPEVASVNGYKFVLLFRQ